MPRDEQRPIRFTVHARIRMADRGIDEDQARLAIRHGAWEANGGRKWRTRATLAGRTLDMVFVEHDEVQQDGKLIRVIEVLLVVTVIDMGRFQR
jgi:hypothetical protein